uniref:LsmAD domain-containing protein n=1 Tax=Kalanchoe fedtschenkoi TaxID=63787 RepID=A0A7N0TWI7_KALFE
MNMTAYLFQANEALFGVKSTFDEELYTTKLERGPQTRELEREALRIAREIEGEETHDLHLAEERGVLLDEQFDIDEESKYSSVLREIDDSRYDEINDLVADSVNCETFGASLTTAIDSAFSPGSSSLPERHPSQPCCDRDPSNSTSSFDAETNFASLDSEARGQENQFFDARSSSKESLDKQVLVKKASTSQTEDSQLDLDKKYSGSGKESQNTKITSATGTKKREKTGSATDSTEVSQSSKNQSEPKSAKSREQPGLSPSSSIGSISSEKSTLNPHAKEFKLNPNAKSFVPTQTNSRPLSPVSNGSFYYPNSVPHMPMMPVGVGIGPPFAGHQPVIYNPQGAPLQSPQGYYHPNGPQYGQHMVLGPTRPVMYMPGYPPEMPYKREY